MDNKTKQFLVDTIAKISKTLRPATIKHKDKSLVVLPVEDNEQFQQECEENMERVRQELEGLLALVRKHTGHQSLEEVEAKIEQEQES
jgi:hypothetical protein